MPDTRATAAKIAHTGITKANLLLVFDSIEISHELLLICRSEPCAIGHHSCDDHTPVFGVQFLRCGRQFVALLAIPLKDRFAIRLRRLLACASSAGPAAA